jgi:hypothetical protein
MIPAPEPLGLDLEPNAHCLFGRDGGWDMSWSPGFSRFGNKDWLKPGLQRDHLTSSKSPGCHEPSKAGPCGP